MASIVALTYGDAEFGTRIAGVTYQLMRDKGVMLAPVKVLHLPEPRALAVERLGEDAATKLLEESAAISLAAMVEEVLGAPPPAGADQLAVSGADSAG